MLTMKNNKNTGIEIISKVYNREFKYSAQQKVYILNQEIILEEYKRIEIETNISNKKELVDFIEVIRKTDLVTMFDYIILIVDFNELINSSNLSYVTIFHREESLDSENKITKKEFYTVSINTKKL